MSSLRKIEDPAAERERIAGEVEHARPVLLRARELAAQDGRDWRSLPAGAMAEYMVVAQEQLNPRLFEREVLPKLTVAVDASLCIVLRTPERTFTVTSIDQLKAALDDARSFRDVLDADAEVERRRAVHTVRRQPVKRCEARSSRTGGACDLPLDAHGYCPRPSDHTEE